MKTTARMSIFVFLAVATTTTALTFGTSTASNTHKHHVNQLKSNGDDWFSTVKF